MSKSLFVVDECIELKPEPKKNEPDNNKKLIMQSVLSVVHV